ncbi:MAG TPA: ribonuclease Z, partial [Bacteroidia bacterium]|nr:ribonuclease Z [Bacteroidia bacterium]
MSIEWRILGKAGADNALHATVDTGQSRTSLLFDCGEHCLDELRPTEVQSVAHVCFSHFHMDHVAGFDGFFRLNYNRPDAPVFVWGPEGTIPLMAYRFQGFVWNLHAGQPGEWIVREVTGDRIGSSRFLTREAFSTDHREPDRPCPTLEIHREDAWHLEAMALPHGSIPSLAYRLVESDRSNIDPAALAHLGWKPGPWLKQVVDPGVTDDATVSADAETKSVGELRETLLTTTPGESIAWLTDFRAEPGSEIWDRLVS